MPDNTLFNPQMMLGMGGAAFAQRHPAYAQQHPGQGGAQAPAPGTPAPAPAPGTPAPVAHQGHPNGGAQHWGDIAQQYQNPDGSGWDIAGLRAAFGDFHNAMGDWRDSRPGVLAGGARNPAYLDWFHQRPQMMNYLHPQTPAAPGTPAAPAPPAATTPPLTNPGTQVGPVNALPQMGNVGSSYGVIGANPAANPYGLPTY